MVRTGNYTGKEFAVIKSKKYRDGARGQQCTINIAGVCNYQEETVCLIHLPDDSHGIAQKADDISAADACSACHDAVDRRVMSREFEDHRDFYMRRGQTRTIRRRIEQGILKL